MILFSLIYSAIVLLFISGLLRKQVFQNKEKQKFSIIIAARNEEKFLSGLLQRSVAQNYPSHLYEIIVADDDSYDKTGAIIQDFAARYNNIHYLKVEPHKKKYIGKKGALIAAIDSSKNELLAFTDADCLPSANWLNELNKHFTEQTDFIAGYSPLIIRNRFLSALKNFERAAHFSVAAGTLGINWKITCTARNIAYRKSCFRKAGGFSEIGHIRSGDDDLLMQKMAKNIRKARFMYSEDSVVPSYDKDTTGEMIDLESRRASKWIHYPTSAKLLTLFFMIYYLVFCVFLFSIIFNKFDAAAFFPVLFLKIIPEFVLLLIFLIKIKRIKLLWVFPIVQLIYIPYFIFFGLKGTFGSYKWKQ